ncbi:zinc finger protein ZAT1-like [Abrus precatorius]|uniref:Zinc finger protein ZAT1-like n=1 Tax=Abrus precatorius TaxID=3816 RepID=A0A8B8M5I0_ABRPR|nr:zinc finger protein ZAT1-like [Abrus precatorius]
MVAILKRQRENQEKESIDLANSLMLLSRVQQSKPLMKSYAPMEFECKTCNRKFSSFQALGGHRASHKKPKFDGEDLRAEAKALSLWNKPKMHECSICGMEFSLGQALGGHMRKHRGAINEGFSSITHAIEKAPVLKRSNSKRVMSLDLNLTPLENDLQLLFGKKAPQVDLSLFVIIDLLNLGDDSQIAIQLWFGEFVTSFVAMKRPRDEGVNSIDLANCLILLSHPSRESKPKKRLGPEEFKCSTCNRKFSSFQALGGHRASHKKPKLEGKELKEQDKALLSLWNKPKTHECSICGLEFALGQALGGHMRKHRIVANEGFSSINQVVAKVPVMKRSNSMRFMFLDLNLTPLQNDLKLLFGNMAPKVDSFV